MKYGGKKDRYLRTLFWTLFLLCIALKAAYGETHYVTDMLILTFREGPGRNYKVIRTLETNTPVELLEETDRYYKVRTKENEEGWMEKQYITSDIPKTIIISELEKEISQLKEKIQMLGNILNSLRDDLNDAKLKATKIEKKCREDLSQKTGEMAKIRGEYKSLIEQKKGGIKSGKEFEQLRKENEILKRRIEHLEQENQRSKISKAVLWFLAGNGVFIAGLITGKISRKKKIFY